VSLFERFRRDGPLRTWPRLNRFQAFLLVSAAIIAIAVVSLGLAVGQFFEHYIIAHEQDHMATEVRAEARQHLTAGDFRTPHSRSGGDVFQALLETLPGVSRIVAFDRTGRVVGATDLGRSGSTIPEDDHVVRALAGNVVAVVEATTPPVMKTYIPLTLPGSSALVGVIETSKDFGQGALGIRRMRRLIMSVAGAMGLFLYVTLGFVVWKASVAERKAISRLEVQNRELTLIHYFTRSLLASLDPGRLAKDIVGRVGVGLDLRRAALCRVHEGRDLSLLADWSPDGVADSVPRSGEAVGEALETRRPAIMGTTVAVPLFMPSNVAGATTYLFMAVFKRPQTAMPLLLDIMLDEASLSLANAGLFTAIRDAHERLAAILAGIADRMVILDRNMCLVWMNEGAKEAYGPAGSPPGPPCFEVLGERARCEECPAVRAFHSGRLERGMRTERLAGGEVRHLDLVTTPLFDAAGAVHQVLEVARDITELVQLEERLKNSHAALLAKTEELEAANQALGQAQAQLVEKERLAAAGQVVVGLHHSILNPLAGILGALQVLKQEELPPSKRAEAFSQAEAEIHKIEQVVRGLSAIRRVAGTPYIGTATMLDLERSCQEDERA
jgi:PAS domain-containing protein